jgi:hypothetical protein
MSNLVSKNITKLAFIALFALSLLMFGRPISLIAQTPKITTKDTLATLVLDNVVLGASNELSFELRLLRFSDKWINYANGTYQIIFDDNNIKINKDSLDIQFSGKSDLKLETFSGGASMPTAGYSIDAQISFNNRISVMVAGPQDFLDCKSVPKGDSGILIGQFVLKGKNGFLLPEKIKWMEPYIMYQACAYKLPQDSLIAPFVVWNYKNSNIELFDSVNSVVLYKTKSVEPPNFALDFFKVEYEGQKVIDISWKTSSEPFNAGFTLVRGSRYDLTVTPDQVEYKDTIASYPPDLYMKGVGKMGEGALYFIQDTVADRGYDYCYQLSYRKENRYERKDTIIARACANVPNAVIYEATAAPNPFKNDTKIMFWLEDDVTLTSYVRDLTGREIRRLCTDKPFKQNMKKDPHILDFSADDLSANGLYEVVLIGIPIKDSSIKQSTATIKLQLLR